MWEHTFTLINKKSLALNTYNNNIGAAYYGNYKFLLLKLLGSRKLKRKLKLITNVIKVIKKESKHSNFSFSNVMGFKYKILDLVKYLISELIYLYKLPLQNINKHHLKYLFSSMFDTLGKGALKNPIDVVVKLVICLLSFLNKTEYFCAKKIEKPSKTSKLPERSATPNYRDIILDSFGAPGIGAPEVVARNVANQLGLNTPEEVSRSIANRLSLETPEAATRNVANQSELKARKREKERVYEEKRAEAIRLDEIAMKERSELA